MSPAAILPRAGGARARCGFTLLEVLLALALFATSVVVLTSAYLNIIEGLAAVQTDRGFEQEVRWTREQVLLLADRADVEKGGDWQTPSAAAIRWTATVQEAAVPDLFTLELEVEMASEGERAPHTYHERLTVLRPSWSEPVARGKLFEAAKTKVEDERRQRGMAAEKRT